MLVRSFNDELKIVIKMSAERSGNVPMNPVRVWIYIFIKLID